MSDYTIIAAQLRDEAIRAASKHAPMHSHHEAKAVIEEEFDEYWDLVKLNPRKPMTHPTKGHAMTSDQWRQELRDELVQMGAMCVRALHDLCEETADVTEPSVNLRTDIKGICGSTRPEIGDCVRPAGHQGSHRGYNGNLWEAQ